MYHYAGNNPVKYTDPDGRLVDYALIGQLEGSESEGYVPNNGEGYGSYSGVTIAVGFDLGQQNEWDLRRIFEAGDTNKDLKDLFTPYLGKKGTDAFTYLQDHPLVLTDSQIDRVNTCVLPAYLKSISDYYNDHVDEEHNWDTLPDQAQTVLFSIAFHRGNGGLSQDLMDAIASGQYSQAADLVEAMGVGTQYADRRKIEANLLRQLPNTTE